MNVIITGASKGIGKAIANAFAAEGANLFLCARNEDDLLKTAALLTEKYPESKIRAKIFDLAKKENAEAFGNWCLQFAVPDILINNAGQFIAGSIIGESEGNLENLLAINLFSAYHLTRALLPQMIAVKTIAGTNRHIFNICSIASLHAYPNGGSYSISKFALDGFSKNLREELRQSHIKVTGVYPGAVMTDSWSGFDNTAKRIMEAEDIAKMILASTKLSNQAVVEDIVMRPLLGDL